MEVQRMMRHRVRACHPHDSLNEAAQIMWEDSAGSVPVVDDHLRPVGILTDRDVCMAAYIQGAPLPALRVESAMARKILSCHPNDDVADAARVMGENGVRRLLVLDNDGTLIGLLSLDDLACESHHNLRGAMNRELVGVVAEAYGSICFGHCQRRNSPDPPVTSSSHAP